MVFRKSCKFNGVEKRMQPRVPTKHSLDYRCKSRCDQQFPIVFVFAKTFEPVADAGAWKTFKDHLAICFQPGRFVPAKKVSSPRACTERKEVTRLVHVVILFADREEAIDVMNQARYFLPHLYALSVNSPFWLGQNTGLKAYRQMIFERLPRTGIPDAFQSLSEYEDYWKLLVATNCIDNPKKIWWDARLHPFFDTIEFRICDAQSRVDDTIALAALMQAIVFKLQKLRRNNVTFRSYQKRLLDENRWRAGRYGSDGKLIDFGRKCEVDERDLLGEMLEFVSDEVEELGNEHEIEHIHRIMREGTGADRQLMVWERTQDMKAVVDHIVAETNEGLAV